jgi:hypothetical protein
MPRLTTQRSKPTAAVAVVLLLAGLLLSACGGSSGKTTSATASASTSAAATTSTAGGTSTTPAGGPKGALAGRFAALRECMAKNGITLPKRTPGQRRAPGAGGFLGGGAGPQLPKGVTRAQYEAAVKKCGGGAFRGSRGPRTNNPGFRQALTRFAACMRENGVKLPEPNTSGKGPVFNTGGVDTASSQFKAAERKCSPSLRGAFGGGAATGGGAAPGAAGATG